MQYMLIGTRSLMEIDGGCFVGLASPRGAWRCWKEEEVAEEEEEEEEVGNCDGGNSCDASVVCADCAASICAEYGGKSKR